MDIHLLPKNGTALEHALEAVAARISNVAPAIDQMLRPKTCPDAFLPWLAWALSVDEWDAAWPVERKRDAIAASIDMHRHKGTIWAMRRALEVAGYGTARIVEHFGAAVFDGAVPRDGSRPRKTADHWAEYRVILDKPITTAQAMQLREICRAVAPAHCALKVLQFARALNIYDAAVQRDGSYTRGVA